MAILKFKKGDIIQAMEYRDSDYVFIGPKPHTRLKTAWDMVCVAARNDYDVVGNSAWDHHPETYEKIGEATPLQRALYLNEY